MGAVVRLAALVPIIPYCFCRRAMRSGVPRFSRLGLFGIGVVKAAGTNEPRRLGLEVVALAAFRSDRRYFFGSLLPGLLGVAGISAL